MFKKAYASRRCLIPIDGFFEWKDIFGTGKNKQSYAIASGEPFALAGIWKTWRNPQTGCVITCSPNEMMATEGLGGPQCDHDSTRRIPRSDEWTNALNCQQLKDSRVSFHQPMRNDANKGR